MGRDTGLLSARVKSHLNLLFIVMATLLIGNAIHVSVVAGEQAITSPNVVLQALVGAVFGIVGYRFRRAPRQEQVGDAGEADEEEFDEELSPLDEDDLERLEE